jgi:hypothetical protein
MRSTEAGFRRGTARESAADLLVRVGPTIRVDVGLRSRGLPGQTPDLSEKRVLALIDTGAGGECIDDTLAQALRLPVHDEGEIGGVGGLHRAFIYRARLYVPALDTLLFQPFTGVRLEESGQAHRVILGRSFLRHDRLGYDGPTGRVEITEV